MHLKIILSQKLKTNYGFTSPDIKLNNGNYVIASLDRFNCKGSLANGMNIIQSHFKYDKNGVVHAISCHLDK